MGNITRPVNGENVLGGVAYKNIGNYVQGCAPMGRAQPLLFNTSLRLPCLSIATTAS